MHRLLLIILCLATSTYNYSQQPAFPTAYGAGAYVTGGRGGDVYHVTTLADSGPGSLRYGLDAANRTVTTPRTIVFDVSGVINLVSSDFYGLYGSSNITIAGQTAPAGGITIDGNRGYFRNVDNAIVRHIRFKGGIDNTTARQDTFSSDKSMTNQIYDHCSFAFGDDESGSFYCDDSGETVDNITVQRCLFAESQKGSIFGGSSGGPTTGDISFNNNMFYNAGYRFPNIAGDAANIEVINNVVWGPSLSTRLIRGNGSFNLNHINNYIDFANVNVEDRYLNLFRYGTIPQIYSDGNKYIIDNPDTPNLTSTVSAMNADNDLSWKFFMDDAPNSYGDQLPANYFTSTQHSLVGRAITIQTADNAFTALKADIGCNARLNADGSVSDNTDTLDSGWLANVNADTVVARSASGTWNVPAITSVSRDGSYYVSNAHIPETWFLANVPTGEDHNDIAPNGYTWLEEFLNGVDEQSSGNSQVSAGADINICEGSNTTLTASGSQSYLWETGETTASITVAPNETTTYTVTGTDSDGNESTDSVTVTVNPIPMADAGIDGEICQDDSIVLNASGGDFFEWSSGQTSQSITVNPNDTTTYTVTVTTNGCSTTDEVTVTVRPRPSINAGNDVDIYQNESITLNASGDGTFVWSTGEETQSITVSPLEITTYTVTANLNGCTSSDSVIVTVLEPDTVNANAGEDKTICENESVTLTASGGPNYLWNTGEPTQSITVSPTVTTTYSVTVSNDFNTDIDDVIVNVNPYPTASAGDDRAILHGDAITLSASGGSEFIWSTGETTQEIEVEPLETTTYTVEVIENDCSDIASVTVVVGVSASVGGEPTICQGQSTTLYAAGGSYFLWSTGETTQSIEVSPTQTTTYSVVVSNNNSSDEAEITVNVNLVPEAYAGEDVTIESGQNVTLTASGGNSYLWSNSETTQSISVSPTGTTTYTVESIINGCSNSDDVKVSVVQQVNANAGEDMQICLGESTELTATGGLYFTWDTGVESASIEVSPLETTVYSVTVSNGFSSQTAEVVVTVEECQDIDNLPQNFESEFRVYPNPTNGQVNIRLSGIENVSSIYVSDLTGKVISTETFEANDGYVINKQYDFSSFSKGIYLITFKQIGEVAITKKLIVK